MGHSFKHLALILRHRHRVIRNASHCGIFFQSLFHDLTKFSPAEFRPSSKYYVGDHSPVYEQRLRHGYFSTICQHHTKRNKHHWEYWTDFFAGRIVVKAMPWNWAMEYICDMISASYCYNPKEFKPETTYLYFEKFSPIYYMNQRTLEFVKWGLAQYRDFGFKGLKKKITKAKYLELSKIYPEVDVIVELHPFGDLPEQKLDI